MFVFSVKVTKKRLTAACACLALFFLFTAVWTAISRDRAVSSPAPPIGEQKQVKISYDAKTNQDRIAFLANFGYETSEEPDEVTEVLIPYEFDTVYEAYNEIQKQQGLDLIKYKGKRAKRYTYTITNYPGKSGENVEAEASLLVYNNKIIGGDVSAKEAGGFSHGFRMS